MSDEERKQYHLSKENLTKVFAEWYRRWKAAVPGGAAWEDDPTGEGNAEYFIKLVKEVLDPDGPAPAEEGLTVHD